MHWWRRLRRGVQPARLLATAVGAGLAIPVLAQLLHCRRKISKQGTLRPSDRFQNVRDAFRVSAAYDITDQNILLVDDVMTTGATASEAARVLPSCRGPFRSVAVVARGLGQGETRGRGGSQSNAQVDSHRRRPSADEAWL